MMESVCSSATFLWYRLY